VCRCCFNMIDEGCDVGLAAKLGSTGFRLSGGLGEGDRAGGSPSWDKEEDADGLASMVDAEGVGVDAFFTGGKGKGLVDLRERGDREAASREEGWKREEAGGGCGEGGEARVMVAEVE